MWLDKCLKSPISENPSTGNMINGPKYCFNPIDSTFTVFIDLYESNWVGKRLWMLLSIFEMYVKFWTFSKEYDTRSWCVSESSDWEVRGPIIV